MIASLAEMAVFLPDYTTAKEPLVQQLLESASARVVAYCNREFEYRTGIVEVLNGRGMTMMPLRALPIKSISQVKVDGVELAALSSSPYTGPGYRFDDSFVYAINTRFTKGYQNIEITYSGGYEDADMPLDLKQVVMEMVALYLQERTRVGLQSMSIQGETTAYTRSEMPDHIKAKLAGYRSVMYFSGA